MAVYELLESNHPSLSVPLTEVTDSQEGREQIQQDLVDTMRAKSGIGLSANQIGIWERAFAMVRDLENNEVMVCFNPRIVKSYSEEVEMEEGCLSYPELFLKIKRPDKIVVKYEDEDKKIHKIKLQGLASRVFQHEYDHMEGIDFTQRT